MHNFKEWSVLCTNSRFGDVPQTNFPLRIQLAMIATGIGVIIYNRDMAQLTRNQSAAWLSAIRLVSDKYDSLGFKL